MRLVSAFALLALVFTLLLSVIGPMPAMAQRPMHTRRPHRQTHWHHRGRWVFINGRRVWVRH